MIAQNKCYIGGDSGIYACSRPLESLMLLLQLDIPDEPHLVGYAGIVVALVTARTVEQAHKEW